MFKNNVYFAYLQILYKIIFKLFANYTRNKLYYDLWMWVKLIDPRRFVQWQKVKDLRTVLFMKKYTSYLHDMWKKGENGYVHLFLKTK